MALNPIIEAFLAAREQASRDFNQIQNRKFQAEQQQEQFKQQLEVQKNNLAQEKVIRDAEHALRQKEIDLQGKLGGQQRDLQALSTVGELTAKGMLKLPSKQGLNPNFMQVGEQTTQEVPDLDAAIAALAPLVGGDPDKASNMLKMLTPSNEYYGQQLQLKEREAGIKAKQLREVEGLKHNNKLEEIGAQNDSREAIASANRTSQEEVAKIRANATLSAAAMRTAAKASKDTGTAIEPQIMGGFIDGSYSIDDMPKMYSIKERSQISKSIASDGYKILGKPDIKLLDRAGVISETVRNIEDLGKLYRGGYVKNYAQINSKRSAIESVLGNLARGVSGESGVLTQADIERVKGILPSWYGSMLTGVSSMTGAEKFDVNQDKVKQLKSYVKNTFGHVFYNMRDDQAGILTNKFGLNNSGVYSPKKSVLLDTPPK